MSTYLAVIYRNSVFLFVKNQNCNMSGFGQIATCLIQWPTVTIFILLALLDPLNPLVTRPARTKYVNIFGSCTEV